MRGLRVEYRLVDQLPLSQDIAEHMHANSVYGGVAIVAKHPARLHALLRRQWFELIRTSGSPALTPQTRQLHFSADLLHSSVAADVTIATADEFLLAPPICRIMYVTYALSNVRLRQITGFMPEQALVVLYEEPFDE